MVDGGGGRTMISPSKSDKVAGFLESDHVNIFRMASFESHDRKECIWTTQHKPPTNRF